jgi:hypothetical protein
MKNRWSAGLLSWLFLLGTTAPAAAATISGVTQNLDGSLCTAVTVRVYDVDQNGKLVEPAFLSFQGGDDGTFSIDTSTTHARVVVEFYKKGFKSVFLPNAPAPATSLAGGALSGSVSLSNLTVMLIPEPN